MGANDIIQLDHLIILVPYAFLNDPPTWLTRNFTISPGGRHTDERTENRLILLRDGTYLELIAFVNDDPTKRASHRWDVPFGVVDYALTTPERLDYDALQKRLADIDSSITYTPPRPGGRTKPDGLELKWEVTIPEKCPPKEVPFWCTDVTPRERRVPVNEGNAKHPCGARGVHSIVLKRAGAARGRELTKALEAITRSQRLEVGTPLGGEDGERATLHVQSDESSNTGATGQHEVLEFTLRCDGKTPEDIDEIVGDGRIRINFVSDST